MKALEKASLPLILLVGLVCLPQSAAADCDTGTEFEMLRCRLDQMLGAMQQGQQYTNRTRIQDSIDSAVTFVKKTLPAQADIDAFEPMCGDFKTYLGDLVALINDTTNSLLQFNSLPTALFVQDPGLAPLIQGLPCDFLQPVYIVADAAGLLDGSVISMLEEVPNALDTLRPVVFPGGASLASSATTGLDDPRIAASCSIVTGNDDLVANAHLALNGVAYSVTALAAILKAVGKTGLTAVKEAHVAAWGWAGGTIEHNNIATAGNFLAGIGDVLTAAGGAVSRKRVYCALRADHLALLEEYEALKCGQTEIIRLLLTPHGLRESDFSHESGCEPEDLAP